MLRNNLGIFEAFQVCDDIGFIEALCSGTLDQL